jgi:hypothetical protein
MSASTKPAPEAEKSRETVPLRGGIVRREVTFDDESTLFVGPAQFFLVLRAWEQGQKTIVIHSLFDRHKIELKRVTGLRAWREPASDLEGSTGA